MFTLRELQHRHIQALIFNTITKIMEFIATMDCWMFNKSIFQISTAKLSLWT